CSHRIKPIIEDAILLEIVIGDGLGGIDGEGLRVCPGGHKGQRQTCHDQQSEQTHRGFRFTLAVQRRRDRFAHAPVAEHRTRGPCCARSHGCLYHPNALYQFCAICCASATCATVIFVATASRSRTLKSRSSPAASDADRFSHM